MSEHITIELTEIEARLLINKIVDADDPHAEILTTTQRDLTTTDAMNTQVKGSGSPPATAYVRIATDSAAQYVERLREYAKVYVCDPNAPVGWIFFEPDELADKLSMILTAKGWHHDQVPVVH